MPPILIQPDNRLLGSANDLSLHGGQTMPGMTIGRPTEAQPAPQVAANAEAPAPAETADAAPLPAIDDDIATPTAAVPASTTAAPAFEPGHIVATPSTGDGVFSSGATAPSTLFFTSGQVQHQPSGEAQQPASLTAPAAADGALTAPLVQHSDGVGNVIDHVVPDMSPVAAATEALGQVTDMLDGIAGIDPAAGIETIVDLMKTADIFELRATTGDVVDHGTAPILDVLAFDITDGSPLLGDHDAHQGDDGLLGAIDTDHGLPGLG